jgi:hypothetical protein
VTARSRGSSEAGAGFQRLAVGGLTWIGFALVVAGWAAALLGMALSHGIGPKTQGLLAPAFHEDLREIARGLVISGFGLAIVGTLRAGFGALDRFFGAVLMRSVQRDAQPAPPAPRPEAVRSQRPYRILADGQVEVDTIVGTRVFKTMAEAREFI